MLTGGYDLSSVPLPEEKPFWADILLAFRRLESSELAAFDPSGTSVDGYGFTTIVTEGRLYLVWLMKQIEQLGGRHERRHVSSLDELADYDAVVNCTGLMAPKLVDGEEMYPIRGHVIRVRAPWVRQYTNKDKDIYIIPNTDTVVLGGTIQKGDWDTVPRPEERARILERCYSILPSLRRAPIVREWVGLRPGRAAIRLELERRALPATAARRGTLPVVHNYGHGGSGLTLAWGCAADAMQLVQAALQL
ncbi:hypothetical protein APUTEX25_001145 [Auxenochlorella protothecoides]|nr:hypothetical protein APUTEX25_001145 [Auxenochlorella protothecoides]|eukprot:RMZ53026.1 hypothetical protein APUTEX25_001145 [Auxenochlorella protothecoides]